MSGSAGPGREPLAQRLAAGARGTVNSVIVGLNTLVVFSLMIPFALLKAVLRVAPARRFADRVLNALASAWVRVNGWWIDAARKVRWDVEGIDALNPRGWYLVSSNHRSWVDIVVLQKVFLGRIPFLKFFLKRELIYVPVIGLAWWALDFPFMQRKGGIKSGKTDLANTRKACERFKLIPTSVMNFLEGTRYTAHKHAHQRSPYLHLLKPRIGGLAIALGTMGEMFDCLLDVTVVYPQGVPVFWDILSGRLREVVVRVRQVAIPAEFLGRDYEADPGYRAGIQAWVGDLWAHKDREIGRLLDHAAARASARTPA